MTKTPITTLASTVSPDTKRAMLAAVIRKTSEERKIFPLSFAQQRLWFIDQLEPGSPVYNIPEVWRLTGELDVALFTRCINEILQRHDVLRTTFGTAGGEAFQIVSPFQPISIPVINLADSESPETEARRMIEQEVRRPFDLLRGPLFRIELLRLESQEHIAILTMHHIISDDSSFEILRREISALYKALLSGNPSPLPALPIQYADFAQWQRQQLTGSLLNEQLEFWRKQLAGAPQLDLPADRARPAAHTFRGATQLLLLSNSLTDSLKALSRKQGVTLFMTLLAAFKTLLHRYTNQDDIVIGTPISGRSRVETEGLIGFFVNTLALRTNVGGDPTFRELLVRVRDITLSAYVHQELPFEQLVRELQPERSLKQNPLFQIVFGYQGASLEDWTLGSVGLSFIEFDLGASKFDWTLMFKETPRGLEGYFEYNTDIFQRETITRVVRHFQTLLEGIVAAPDQKISRLPLLTEAERHQLLVEWNHAQTDYERDVSVAELFEEQAAKNPDAVALQFENHKISFCELNERANQLAYLLQKFGVGPDVLVGLCLERSVEMIVAILGILKAGGAFVPFDPANPKERLTQMFQAAPVQLILTHARFDEKILPVQWTRVICLETDAPLIAKESRENPRCSATAENLAYVMFTSGSTGKPKAVAITHRNITRLVRNTNYAEFSPQEIFLQFAPLSFDASTFEIFGSLLNGAQLIIFPPHFPSLEELGETIRREKITTLWLTAGLFHQMVEQQLENLKGVRQLLSGGDVLSVPHVMTALRELKNTQLINGYGPTETCTFACFYRVPKDWRGESSLPIGRPVSNTQVYVLDENLFPVPIGVPGELYIGGDGVGCGYLNDAELTAKRFVLNPFVSDSLTPSDGVKGGSKIYRTGDVVRWLPDGNIEFIGRRDLQVKIRGFRIELGEIENVLSQHHDLAESIIVARTTDKGDKQLVAYLVSRSGEAPSSSELRKFLERQLPSAAIPTHFVSLKRLPLTPNGKVDRAALPQPDENAAFSQTGNETPETQIETALAKIWSEVLGVKQISRNDNFFELGGHSLLVTRVASRVRKSFQVEVSIRDLFETPTLAALSEHVEKLLIKQISEMSDEEVFAVTQC